LVDKKLEVAEDKNVENEEKDDLSVPAFIRKKMGN
jgi:hypothetical protein